VILKVTKPKKINTRYTTGPYDILTLHVNGALTIVERVNVCRLDLDSNAADRS
jgi:hypothetical protein